MRFQPRGAGWVVARVRGDGAKRRNAYCTRDRNHPAPDLSPPRHARRIATGKPRLRMEPCRGAHATGRARGRAPARSRCSHHCRATRQRASPVWAVMDIANNGSVLDAGRFTMRITNIGVDRQCVLQQGAVVRPAVRVPEGQRPRVPRARRAVGGRDPRRTARTSVSGGPMLECASDARRQRRRRARASPATAARERDVRRRR